MDSSLSDGSLRECELRGIFEPLNHFEGQKDDSKIGWEIHQLFFSDFNGVEKNPVDAPRYI